MSPTAEIIAERYRLGPLLGQGGMSDVYEAMDRLTDAVVAVKIVRSGDPALKRSA
jgi:serine/threonine protein kinase